MYRVKFSEEAGAMVARIGLPSPSGVVTVKTSVPLSGIADEVKTWLAAHSQNSVGDDLALLQKLPAIVGKVARHRLIRKLHDSVGAWPGGPKTAHIDELAREILTDARGPAGVRKQVAIRKLAIITKEARKLVPSAAIALAALRRVNNSNTGSDEMNNSQDVGDSVDVGGRGGRGHDGGHQFRGPRHGMHRAGDDVGEDVGADDVGGFWSKVKSAAKGIGKAAVKADQIVTTNPLAKTLISAVPGGAAAIAASDYGKQTLKVIKAAKAGNPKALESIDELKKEAAGGNQQAKDALLAMQNVNQLAKGKKPAKSKKSSSSLYMRGVRAGVNPSIWG